MPTASSVQLSPTKPGIRETYLSLVWPGARIEVDEVSNGTAVRLLTGAVADLAWRDGAFQISFADNAERWNQAIVGRFAGNGGAEGATIATGRPKRRSWGRVRNVEGRLLDPVNNIYEFGDPAHPLQAISILRDKGREGSSTVLAWQGSIASTLAALAASTPVQGGGIVAPSVACAKWWTQPAAPLTADIEGETAGGFVETAPAIAARLMVLAGGAAPVNLATAVGWRGGAAGLHVDSDTETWSTAIDRVLLGVSLLWVPNPDGSSRIARWSFEAPAEALNARFIAREKAFPPTAKRTVIFQLNHRVHGDGEVSAAVQAGGSIFIDGINVTVPPSGVAPLPPTDAFPGYIWHRTSDRRQFVRLGESVQIDGMNLLIDGMPLVIPELWEEVKDAAIDVAQAAADSAIGAANLAQEYADAANARIAAISSDSLLTPDEKPRIIQDRDVILAEQAGIEARATALSITTEKTAYTNSISALTSYLATLTAPVLWSNLAGDTAIVGSAFRTAFANVFVAKQTLLDKIAAQTQVLADLGISNAADAYDLAAEAAAAAAAAQADVNTLSAKVDAIDDDDILSISEKVEVLIPAAAAFAALWTATSTLAATAGITSEAVYTTASTKRTAWLNYLDAISPAWNNIAVASPITRGALDTARSEYDAALKELNRAATEAMTAARTPDLTGNFAWGISADFTGATITTPLPADRRFKAMLGANDVSPTTNFEITGTTGAVAVTVNNTAASANRGVVTLGTGTTGSGTATLKATLPGGAVVERVINITKTNAAPPSGGGGGGGGVPPAQDTTFFTIGSNIHAQISDELTMTADASGNVRISIDLAYEASGGTGTRTPSFKVAYATTAGGALTDLFAEEAGSSCIGGFEPVPGSYVRAEATFNVGDAGAVRYFKLLGRRSTGSSDIVFTGNAFTIRQ